MAKKKDRHNLPGPLSTIQVRNRLLKTFDQNVFMELQDYLDPVLLKPRQVLHIKGMPIDHCYFVEDGLVSVMADVGDNDAVEAWLIGSEGIVGVSALLSGGPSAFRRVVAVEGRALRVPANVVARLMDEQKSFREVMLGYLDGVLTQAAQAGACASRHSLDQRLARWLLSASYRMDQEKLPLTHSLLARLIGVQRVSITLALSRLAAAKVISTRRGVVTILDHSRLQENACRCDRIVRIAYVGVSSQM